MTIRERLELMELIKQRNDANVRKWKQASTGKAAPRISTHARNRYQQWHQ